MPECNCILTESDYVKECYRNEYNDEIEHNLTLGGGVSVIHNELLQEWREAGFEVYAFGRNRTDIDNLTATMVEVNDAAE